MKIWTRILVFVPVITIALLLLSVYLNSTQIDSNIEYSVDNAIPSIYSIAFKKDIFEDDLKNSIFLSSYLSSNKKKIRNIKFQIRSTDIDDSTKPSVDVNVLKAIDIEDRTVSITVLLNEDTIKKLNNYDLGRMASIAVYQVLINQYDSQEIYDKHYVWRIPPKDFSYFIVSK